MKKILLVDDDLFVLATMAMSLELAGFQVIQVDNGEAAIKVVESKSIDLTVLDMRMPGMSGLEVARVFRKSGYRSFIFLTAFDDDNVVREAAEAGALGYLIKPVELSRMLPTIEVALARHDELVTLANDRSNLTVALNSNRDTDIALGILMERYHIDRARAFNILRGYARGQRCKITDVSQRLIAGEVLD
jgi:response regulator NasT